MAKILVVDDDLDILSVMRILLKTYGFEVEVTPKGEETINKTYVFQPDLILLDVFLSGIDGRYICKELKNNENTAGIPVIMFSANTSFTDISKECKADDFISKPFEVKNLITKINRLVNA